MGFKVGIFLWFLGFSKIPVGTEQLHYYEETEESAGPFGDLGLLSHILLKQFSY